MTSSSWVTDAWIRRGASVALALSWLAAGGQARAELVEDVDRLAEAYERGGAEVTRVPPRFVLAEARVRIALPGLTGLGAGERPCATVIALGARSARYAMRPALPRVLGMVAPSVDAEAGVATLGDCAGRTLATGAVELVMGKRSGAIDVIVVRHRAGALSEPTVVLPERATGPLPPPEPVGPLSVAPIEQRRQRAEEAARRDGSTFVARVDVAADARGRGAIVLRLREGCHRVAVLADAAALATGASPPAVDVDATIRLAGDEEDLVYDRSHAPDARLDFCIGRTRDVELRFVGAGGAVPIVVLTSYWALPSGLPSLWGDDARGGLAWALHRRSGPRLGRAPDQLVAGAAGMTLLPIAVEPSSCYLAALALTRGMASGLRLSVRVGAERRHDDATGGQPAAAVSFCTGAGQRAATLQIDVRSQTAWWGLALWRVGGAS